MSPKAPGRPYGDRPIRALHSEWHRCGPHPRLVAPGHRVCGFAGVDQAAPGSDAARSRRIARDEVQARPVETLMVPSLSSVSDPARDLGERRVSGHWVAAACRA
jgi:hypothetical protein